MKRNSVFVCIATGALLMSCQTAPRVSADLTAHLPARSADSVMIFKACIGTGDRNGKGERRRTDTHEGLPVPQYAGTGREEDG